MTDMKFNKNDRIKDYKMEYLDQWAVHDYVVCDALKEYECSPEKKTYKLMIEIANKHNTTTEKMKEHWRCIEQYTGKEEKYGTCLH